MSYSRTSSESLSAFDSSSYTVGSGISNDIRVIRGQYIGGIPSSKGRLKYLQIQQNDEELLIKLSKPISDTLSGKLQPGMMLQAWVRPKKDSLKALMIVPAKDIGAEDERAVPFDSFAKVDSAKADSADPADSGELPEGTTVTPKPTVCTLKVCTKGKCYKQGAHQIMHALEAALAGLEAARSAEGDMGQRVIIKPTGCLKNCKQGPTVQVSPGSETYSFVRPQDASTILKHHMAY
ncbi:MAG: (2Fe-2S) ferredoxin domain-containing protein [Leptolyngbyaceae bacterium]|nr:(2Fe-2S) ferredoxin domain-containing protein [Leptolyngbyaceae bacterium]